MTNVTVSERAAIRASAEANGCKYRITQGGEVHFYGVMPNANAVGWYFVKYVSDQGQTGAGACA